MLDLTTATALLGALIAALVAALKKIPVGEKLEPVRAALLPLVLPALCGALLGALGGLLGLFPGGVAGGIGLGLAAAGVTSALVHQGERIGRAKLGKKGEA